ncbi:helix-turn-helix transcriptional regulator [Evansella halocellulosilytica]|uniref:helix-turn-helix transcriptional regulator n=1 Tax=Evansella halocellulosilytica TaxID=2011013 RepID=UPI00211C87E6|nr:helix-turn-helix transcriptional regulator [Evansella halocellulosilytica]
MKIGEQIRMLRKSENLSQEQLGEKLNVSRQAVYKWESDKGYPDIQNLITLSELFDISIDELIKKDRVFQRRIIVKGGIVSNRRLLSSLNYFSIFFAPFLFPFITICVGETDIKGHGKKAFISHSIPVIMYVTLMMVFYLSSYLTGADQPNSLLVICGVTIFAVSSISVVIWNVVQGVKVIKNHLKT